MVNKIGGSLSKDEKIDSQSRLESRIEILKEYVCEFGKKEVRNLINFRWDYILIDEGQDFSSDFIDFINLIRPKQSILAGVVSHDQVINPQTKSGDSFEEVMDEFEAIDCKINYRNYSGIREFSYKCFKYLKTDFIKKSMSEIVQLPGEINEQGVIQIVPDEKIHSSEEIYKLTNEIRNFNCYNDDILVIEPSDLFLKEKGLTLFADSLTNAKINSLNFKKVSVKKDFESKIAYQ